MSKVETLTQHTESLPRPLSYSNEGVPTNTEPASDKGSLTLGEINRTDPKVCHDPAVTPEGIARLYKTQHKYNMENQDLSTINEYDTLKLDGIEYPLITINDRNIENNEIINMKINYYSFLPTISITVYDYAEHESKIMTTQMSGLIKVIMISPVDKVYKKIILNFRILNASISSTNTKITTYYGEYYVKEFRNVNTMHIWMPIPCPKPITCEQGGHINANTWEMLHAIAEMTGLGFAATKHCKEIPDHVLRHIHTQRFNNYIEQQLSHCGTDIHNIFDAWVDLYGYIVMINVPWVLEEEISNKELTTIASIGQHPTSNDLPDQKPKDCLRVLTNYNLTGVKSNLEIESYRIIVKNESIEDGTLERIYPIKMTDNEKLTKLSALDIQTKQNSIDGSYIEDYNTGKRRPIPKFDFNDDKWTALNGGYDLNTQKRIRTSFFKKLRQSLLYVKLKTINFGLQRGTLLQISIFENNFINKDFMLKNTTRIGRIDAEDYQEDILPLPSYLNQEDIVKDVDAWIPNYKLSGLYYIDGMYFEYNRDNGKIDQTLILIKKGTTSGYLNRHNSMGVPLHKWKEKQTLQQGKLLNEQDLI